MRNARLDDLVSRATHAYFEPSPTNFFEGFRWLFITSNDLKINENLRPF